MDTAVKSATEMTISVHAKQQIAPAWEYYFSIALFIWRIRNFVVNETALVYGTTLKPLILQALSSHQEKKRRIIVAA